MFHSYKLVILYQLKMIWWWCNIVSLSQSGSLKIFHIFKWVRQMRICVLSTRQIRMFFELSFLKKENHIEHFIFLEVKLKNNLKREISNRCHLIKWYLDPEMFEKLISTGIKQIVNESPFVFQPDGVCVQSGKWSFEPDMHELEWLAGSLELTSIFTLRLCHIESYNNTKI